MMRGNGWYFHPGWCRSDELVGCLLAETSCELHQLAMQLLFGLQNLPLIPKMTKSFSVSKHYFVSQSYTEYFCFQEGKFQTNNFWQIFQFAKIFFLQNFVSHSVQLYRTHYMKQQCTVQITHNLNGTHVSHACAQAKNMHGIKLCMYTHV